jgi:hypothetical protein
VLEALVAITLSGVIFERSLPTTGKTQSSDCGAAMSGKTAILKIDHLRHSREPRPGKSVGVAEMFALLFVQRLQY